MGFWSDFGAGAKIFGGIVHPSLELRVFNIFGPNMTHCAVAFCMNIAICHRRKFGQVWESPAPLPEVAGKLRCLFTIYVVVVVSMDPATPSNTINTHRSWFSAGS